jgi:hypothetical protein
VVGRVSEEDVVGEEDGREREEGLTKVLVAIDVGDT